MLFGDDRRGKENCFNFKMTYQELLNDKRWILKRKEIIQRDNFQCTKCGLNDQLEVHHIRYLSNTKPWEYDNSFLRTLCRGCHEKVKEKNMKDNINRVLN